MDPPRHHEFTEIADHLRISEAAVGALRAAARLCRAITLSSLPLDPGFNSADDQGMFRLVAILLSALWLSGCFVIEEIRKGDALIEQHSVGWREKKKSLREAEAESAKAESEIQHRPSRNAGPGVKDKLSDWWHETVDQEPVTVDRNDKLVSCKLRGKVQFVRKSDCQLRRGEIKELKSKVESTGTSRSKPRQGS